MLFSDKSKDYQRTWQMAKEANAYARSIILKGSTQLENNELAAEYFQHLRRGVEGNSYARIKNPGSKEIGMRDIMDEEMTRRINNGESELLAIFYSVITVSKKYSVGNCYELSFQALDYILNHAPDIKAELYQVENGDHAFLVLNRNEDSFMEDPLTWGENAIVC